MAGWSRTSSGDRRRAGSGQSLTAVLPSGTGSGHNSGLPVHPAWVRGVGMRTRSFLMFLLAVLLLGGASPVFAQKITGDITGTVTDPSGAVVPGATVTAENVGTGLSRSAKTAATGDYRLVELPPGLYKVSVQAAGFKTAVGEVQVAIGIVSHADFGLQVGERTETVTVEAGGAPIATREDRQKNPVGSR